MKTINKYLLSVVLNTEIIEILEDGGNGPNMVQWSYNTSDGVRNGMNMNIYELANLCKEWAKQESVEGVKCVLYSAPTEPKNLNKYICHIGKPFVHKVSIIWDKTFKADSEPEAIFRACEWILDNKDPK
jgi:hypothetical protein